MDESIDQASGGKRSNLDDQKTKCEEYARQRSLNIVGYYGGTHESAQTPGPMIKDDIGGRRQELTSLRKRLTDTEKSRQDCRFRFGTGEIDRETFDITIQALEERKGHLMLTIDECQRDLSDQVQKYVFFASHITTCSTKQAERALWRSSRSLR